jgi:hypothetical protein
MPVIGSGQLEAVGARLKLQGAKGLRRELLVGLKLGAAPLVGDVRAAARAQLPKSGGLNRYVADGDIKVAVRLSGRLTGVRIVNSRKNAKKGGTSDFGTDRGVIRHPVFGTDKWVEQRLPSAGWFSKTLEDKAPSVTPFVVAALESVAVRMTLPL